LVASRSARPLNRKPSTGMCSGGVGTRRRVVRVNRAGLAVGAEHGGVSGAVAGAGLGGAVRVVAGRGGFGRARPLAQS
jgi:hypothetical protein